MSCAKSRPRRNHNAKQSSKSPSPAPFKPTKSTKTTSKRRRGRPKSTKSPENENKNKSKSPENENKNKNKFADDVDSDCGLETISEDGAKKRRSKRLLEIRTRKEEDEVRTDSDSESDSETAIKSNKKRKRKSNDDEKSPPKKKPRKTLHKKADSSHYLVKNPAFTRDIESLVRIGVAYTKNSPKKSKKKAKLHYKTQKTYEKKMYKWHGNGKYKLVEILGHKLEYNMDIVFADYPKDRMWYESINYAPIQAMMEEEVIEVNDGEDVDGKEMENETGDDDVSVQVGGGGDGGGRPQLCLGKLMFECKFEGWGETSWECWDVIGRTDVFEGYVEGKVGEGFVVGNELLSTLHLYDVEEFHGLMMNIALFGNPTTRKALKMMVSKELNVW